MVDINKLIAKRSRLTQALNDMTMMQREMQRTRNQGNFDAGMACVWAAVLLVTDIVKDGVSAYDKRAALAFTVLDKGIDQANKLLHAFRIAPIAKKSDALAALDPNLRQVAGWTHSIRQVQSVLHGAAFVTKPGGVVDGVLKQSGLPPLHPKVGGALQKASGPRVDLMVNLALDMTEDTLLMLNAGQTQNRVNAINDAAIQRAGAQIRKVQVLIQKVDKEIQDWLVYFDQNRNVA